MMNMLAIVISLLCAGFVLFQRHFFGLPGQSREKQSKPGTSRSEPPHAKSLVPSSEILVSKSYRSGLERTGADIGTAPAGGDAIFAPASEEKSAMQGWNTLVVQPPIGEDGELAEPEAPADARSLLPDLPARAELRDAEVHAMLGELDFGESAVMGDATAEERQAIANFDIRAFA